MCTIKSLNLVVFNIGGNENFHPTDAIANMPKMNKNSFVVLMGRAPIWRYIKAFQCSKKAGVIATFDAGKTKAVVVASKVDGWNVDDVYRFNPQNRTVSQTDKTTYDE